MPVVARAWSAAVALVAGGTFLVRLVLVVARDADEPLPTRLLRFVSYFTVQSNLLVAVALGGLALGWSMRSRLAEVVRLDALLGIAVTGLVFQTVLADDEVLTGIDVWTDAGFHAVSPAGAVLGWLLLGPRRRWWPGALALAMVWAFGWLGWTMLHGALTGWYPYPFLDVGELGYARALLHCGYVVALGLVVGALLLLGDRHLPAYGHRTAPAEADDPALRA
ncbi:hypothetical protein D5H78_03415 [Vallicoccus soli]|uniref:F420-dependent oxidoreductase n=1 Tax=Vallicoccus soli TaxID=2339232 RepID=A0A3A3Z4S1_9ACTN|nr:hypothetical protein D5H78_03415 [Vallicoccus soli]